MDIKIPDLSLIDEAADAFLREIGSSRHIAFLAPMGAGKTTFISALCRRLGMEEEASSPTFSIVNEYQNVDGHRVFHFDFYRIDDPAEIEDLGPDEYFDSDALCLMEWPGVAAAFLPEDTRFFKISVDDADGARHITEISGEEAL